MQLHHFGITARNLTETIHWYSEKLGFVYDYTYEVEALNMKAAFMTLDDFRLEIFELQSSAPMPEYRSEVATNIRVGNQSCCSRCRRHRSNSSYIEGARY